MTVAEVRGVWGSMEQKTGVRLPTDRFRRKTKFRDTAANPAETGSYSVAKVWCESGIFRYTYATLFWDQDFRLEFYKPDFLV